MARSVEDLALMLDAMAGEHPADPLSLPKLATSFRSAVNGGPQPKRVAYSPDLGITPVDPEVAAITRKAAERFAEAGVVVEEAHPDFSGVHECFQVLRAYDYVVSKAELLRTKRDLLKPEVVANIEQGLRLTMAELQRAEGQRVAMTARTLACCPALSLPCGFTREGLPVGLQIVAPPRAEARLLAAAKALEDMLGLRGSTPIEPRAETVAAERVGASG